MSKTLQRLHLAVGIVGLLAFLATGLYMHFGHDHLQGMSNARRLLFRSTHIYLLFGAMVNLALGLYLTSASGWRGWVQSVGSLIVLSSPMFAFVGFFTEPWVTDLERPYSRGAAYGCLAGMMLHLMAWVPLGKRVRGEGTLPPSL